MAAFGRQKSMPDALCYDLSVGALRGTKAGYTLDTLTLLHISEIEQLLANLHRALTLGVDTAKPVEQMY